MDFIQENETEKFTESQCDCLSCLQMKISVSEWDSFNPETALQKRMKDVVKRIEYKTNNKKMRYL